MLTLIKAFYQQYFGQHRYNICILGLHETGKSLFFNSIKQSKTSSKFESKTQQQNNNEPMYHNYKPTVGLNERSVTKYENEGVKLTVWDLGGKPALRKIWENYYSESHGLVFLIDHRVQDSISTLKSVAQHPEMIKVPFLILASNEAVKDEIDLILNQSDILNNRAFLVCLLNPKQKISLQSIHSLMKWIYQKIHELHQEVIRD